MRTLMKQINSSQFSHDSWHEKQWNITEGQDKCQWFNRNYNPTARPCAVRANSLIHIKIDAYFPLHVQAQEATPSSNTGNIIKHHQCNLNYPYQVIYQQAAHKVYEHNKSCQLASSCLICMTMRGRKIICTKHKTRHTEQLRSKAVKFLSGRWQQYIHYTTGDVLAHLATTSFMNFIGTASTARQPVILFCSFRRAQTLFYPLHYTSITKMIVLQQSVLLHALV